MTAAGKIEAFRPYSFGNLAGVLAILPWCLLEVALGTNRGLRAWTVALLVGCGVGLVLGAAQSVIRRVWVLRVLATVPPLLLYGRSLIWAVDRAFQLWLPHSATAGLVTALGLTAPLAVALFRLRRRVRIERPGWALGLTLAATLAAFSIALPLAMRYLDVAARVLGFGALAAGVVLLLAGYRQRWLLPLAAVLCGALATMLPASYVEIEIAFVWLAVGLGMSFVRSLDDRPLTWRPAALLALAGVVLLFGANWTLQSSTLSFKGQSALSGVGSTLVTALRTLSDVDRDGYGEWFGSTDCAPFNPRVHPGAREIANNGIDDNCQGGDRHESVQHWLARIEPRFAAPPRWNGDIVLVLFDALRADETRTGRTPAIAALRARGLDYTRAYSTLTFTAESLLGILAGRLVSSVPFHWRAPYNGCPSQPVHGLPRALARDGYATALVGSPAKTTDCFAPTALGDGFSVLATMPYFSTADAVTDRAVQVWKRLGPDRPRFMFVHYLAAHNAYQSVAAYHAAVFRTDRALGRLVDTLGQRVLWVVLADHGEELYERGMRGHANSLFQEVARVPLVMAGPGLPVGRVEAVSSLLQLPGTLLSMVEGGHAPTHVVLCTDPRPGACADAPAPLELWRPGLHLQALVLGKRKIIRDVNAGWLSAFDLATDPEERHPLTPVPPDLSRALGQWEEFAFSAHGPLVPLLPDATRQTRSD